MRHRREILLSAMHKAVAELNRSIESWIERVKVDTYAAVRFSDEAFRNIAAKKAQEWVIDTLSRQTVEQCIVSIRDQLLFEENRQYPNVDGHETEKLMNKYFAEELRGLLKWMKTERHD